MIIGEIGINHNGDIEKAKELIDMAKRNGVDVVKFQKRTPSICVPDNQKNIVKDSPFGVMKYIDYKEKIEFGKEEYDEIDRYCRKKEISWTASVWDIPSLHFIMNYEVPFIKLSSASLTDYDLIDAINEYNVPVIASIGMSEQFEVDNAVLRIDNLHTLMHCKSIYGGVDTQLNLNVIKKLQKYYPFLTIGYSHHDPLITPLLYAKILGAEVFEFHITLDNMMKGSDQWFSLEESDLIELMYEFNRMDKVFGTDEIKCFDEEKSARDKLRVNQSKRGV